MQKCKMDTAEMSNGYRKNVKWIPQKCQMDYAEMSNGLCGNVEPIPDNIPDNIPNNKHNIYTEEVEEIVSYLNEKARTKYRANTAATKRHIIARLNDGFSIEDFKKVIDKKCGQWIGDTKMQKFLRPETLFGSKFEGYLNEQVTGSGYQQQQQYTIGEDGKKYDSWGNELL